MARHLRYDKGNLTMQVVVLCVVLFSSLPLLMAQQYKVVYKQIPDNRGTEFIVGFMQQFQKKLDGATRLFITSDYNTRAVIKTRETNVRKEVEIKARQLYPIDFPTTVRMEGTKIEQKGIHIKSESEIVVYGLNIKKYTTDAFLALPVDIQSTMYIVPSFTPSQMSLIGIVGIHDRTTIFVTFRFADRKSSFKYNGKTYAHRDTLSLMINKLDTFQIAHASDMTGSRIFSTKPISVFSGNECANVPQPKGYCDHLVEHIPPVNTWGQRFITAPLAGRTAGDYFRILAANYSTVVRVNGKHIKTLDEGKFIELDVPSDRYQYIQTSKPCLVLQYSKGQRVDNTYTDPFMIMIPPVEQYTAQYTVSTPDQNEQYFRSYINIIINTKQIDGLRLDGRTLRDERWVPVWGTTHSAARIHVSHGVHRVMHDSPIVPFAIFLYGYARADSYGYPGGLRLADLTLECVPGHPGDGLDNDCDRRIDEEIKNFIDDDNDGRIDEDLVTEPPRIILDARTLILSGCPAEVKKKLKEPTVIVAPLCSSRGPVKLSFVDNVYEKQCVQYIERMWLVRDGCGNLANNTQQIRIKRPQMKVTFPDDVRGKCHLGEDMSEVGEPVVKMSCREDRFSVKYRDSPALVECIRRGRTIAREWTVKASCGSVVKHIQKLLPDVTPPKVNFVGQLQYRVRRDFRISWNASEESTFECSLYGPNNPQPCGRGWGETFSRRDIPDGKHVFWVRATDFAGNTGAYIRHPFQADNSGPRLNFVQPLQYLSRGPMAFKWRSNEMTRFKCSLNPDRMEQCGSGTEGKDYRRNLQDGTYSFYVGGVDQIGNEASVIKHNFRIDSTPPRIKFGKSLRPTINSRVDLPLLSNEETTFYCSLDGRTYANCGEGLRGRFTASKLVEGPHELKVKGVDEAGNWADPISLKWNSDKTSPNILFTPGLPTKFQRKPRLTWTSSEYASFECSLDDNTRFRRCGIGKRGEWTKDQVPAGSHDFFVRGTDRHGNVGPTASFRFLIDNKPPIVYLNKPLPKTSSSPTATFRWTSNEMAYYKCAVDDISKLRDCGSGHTGGWITPPLNNGKHTFYLTAKDEVGNRAPMLSHSWDIDNVAPVLRFRGQLPDNVNKSKQTFQWTSSEHAKFTCFIDSESNVVPCGSGRVGRWKSNELGDGPHTFGVYGTDDNGNQGPTIQHTWRIDTIAPSVDLAKIPDTINKPKAKFTWKATEPSKFLCAMDDGEGEPCGEGTDGEYLTPSLVDGEHEFRLLVEDMVGNMAPLVRSKFDVDTSFPVITFDKADPKTPQKDLSVSWKSSEDSDFECAVDDTSQYEQCGNGKTGAYQKDDLPDGQHKLYVRGKDDVGNVGDPSVYTVTTDRTPPTIRFTDQYKPLSKDPTETFTWVSDEPVTFKCKLDERQEADCGEGTRGQFRTPNLPDGEHVFQVTPIDKAGNKGRMLERKWKKDTTPPHVQYTSQPPKVSRDTVTFKWSSTEDATFECALDDKDNAESCGSGPSGRIGEKTLTNLPKGSRVFWVRGTDSAGNVGQFVPHSWTVDTNPPTIEFTGDLPSFSKKSLKFSWKSNEDSQFECALDDMASFEPCGSGMTGKRELTKLPEGKRTFYVRARDQLDNVGTPISHSWVVDSTPPRAVVDPVSPVVSTPHTTLSWSANERSKFYCAIGDVGNVIECGQGTRGSWTTPYLRRGPQNFWLIAEDYTGNRAEPVSVSWTVDNKAPVVTFTDDSTDKSTTGSPRISWTSDEPAIFECAIQGVTQFQECGRGTGATWTDSNVPDGKRTFLVRARDQYGNQNQPYRFPFEVDTTPPTGFSVTGPRRRTKIPEATFSWRTSEDAKFECYVDGQEDPVDCGEGTSGQFKTKPLPDGDHDFKVTATDDLGNNASVVNAKWTVDTSGPKLSFPDNLPQTTLSNPWFNWTSDEPARFDCSLDGESNWEYCGSGKSGAWQRYNVPDGKHEFFVRGTDDLGNVGPEISHPFTVDYTAPRIRVTTPADRTSSRPTLRWTSSEDVKFQCSFDDGRTFDCGEGKTGTWTGKNVPDGPHKFVIEGKDEVGNTGKYTYSWTKDSDAPAIRFDENQPTTTLRNPRFTWTSSEPAIFECSLDGFANNIENCGSGTSGNWQNSKPDGKYELSVRGKDPHGNTGTPVSHRFTVDNTAPVIKVTSQSDLDSSTPNIKWSSNEDVKFQCSFDDGNFVDCGEGKIGSWTRRNVPDGPHTLTIQGKDVVDNVGKHTFTWNTDSRGPSIRFDPNQPTITRRYPRFTWTSSEPATFECSMDGFNNDIENCGSGTTGAWQKRKPDGDYEVSVRGRDQNGNTGSPVSHSFTVDHTAPVLNITSQPDPKSSSPSIEWSASEDVKFQCSFDDGQYFNCGDGKIGSWSRSNVPDGRHTFVIQAKDQMDNFAKYTSTWDQDSVAPKLSFDQLPDRSSSMSVFTWNSDEFASFECSLDDAKYEKCGYGSYGLWRNRVPGGVHTFSVRATDARGNVGDPIKHTWTIDTTGPVITLDTPRMRQNVALFEWTSNKPATFQCAMDNPSSWQYCGSGRRGNRPYYNLPDGDHTFYVRGTDSRRNVGSPASHRFTVDNKPPEITVTTTKSVFSTRTPTFEWVSSEDATFECAIDETRLYQPCGEGRTGQFPARNVADGRHAFFVRGKDRNENYGRHVRYLFTVDTTGPQVYLTRSVPETTKNPKVFFSWLSNEDADFECTVDRNTTKCGSGTRGEFTTPALRDGPHTFTLTPVDKMGNRGTPVTKNWVTDSSSPEIEFDPKLPRKTSRTPTVSWTSSEYSYFECDLDGVRSRNCGQGTSGEITFTVSKGPHTFSVRGTDRNGNTGDWERYSFDVDAEGPQITFPGDIPRVTKSNPTFSWKSSEHAKFQCGIDNSFNMNDCGEGLDSRWSGQNLRDGSHVFLVIGTDKFGNRGRFAQHRFTVDNTVPTITFQTQTDKTDSKPRVSWISSENADFECSLDGGDFEKCGSGFSGLWTGKNIPDGNHVFSVRGRDKNGNLGESTEFEWTVDNQPPDISITSDNPSATSHPKQRITWDSNEDADFECRLNGQVVDCGSGTKGSYTTPNLPDGEYTFSVNAVDKVGNKGIPKVINWSTDKRPPSLRITSDNPSETKNPKQRITWSSSEDADFECRLDGQVVDCGSGTTGAYTTPDMPDGQHTFSVNAVDSVGNKGTPRFVSWSTDKKPPVLSITSDNPAETNNPRQRITWSSNEDADFECTLDGERVPCGSGFSGVYTTPNLPDGVHTFSVHAVDKVGNKGTPKVINWSTDMEAPVLKITSTNPSVTNNPKQRITWSSNEDADFECRLDGQVVDCGSGTTGTYTTPDLRDGQHTFSVNAVDDVGNKGIPKVVTWATDKRGPPLTITSNNPSETSSPTQRITWSSGEDAKFECRLDGQAVECGRGRTGDYTTPRLPDGKHTFSVNAVDNVGNKGTPEVVNWATDTTPPTVKILNKIPRETNKPQIKIAWTSSESGKFECMLDGIQVSCGRGVTGDYTTPELGDGKHWFTVTSVDRLGNKGKPVKVEWDVDSTPPDIQFSSTLPQKTTANPEISWRSSEEASFECAFDDPNRNIRCGEGLTSKWAGLNIPHGPHTFWVRGTDPRGNVGDWKPYTFEVDSTGPNITFSNEPRVTKDSPIFTWSSSEPAQFKCRMENSLREEDCGGGMIGKWSGNQIPDGPHKFMVYGVDEMNNKGPVSELDFKVDATGPKISFPADQPVLTKNNPVFTWKSSEPAKFKCGVEGYQGFDDCGDGRDSHWIGDNLPDGDHKFQVYGTDDMNNTGPVAEHEFTVDNSAPVIIFSKADDVTDSFPRFTWSSKENAQYECSLDGAAFKICGRGKTGEWNGRNIPHGQHLLSVRGTDENGNVGVPTRHTWNVDTRPPNVEIQEPFPRKTSDNAITIRWTSDEDAQFKCAVDNSRPVSCGFGKDGQWETPRMNDGDHVFSLLAEDPIGNSAPVVRRRWTVDSTSPKITFPSDQPVLTQHNPKFTWTSSEPAKFKCAIEGHQNFVDCGEGTSGKLDGNNIPDGNYKLLVYGTDDVNNTGPVAEHTFVVDATPPEITFSGNLPETTGRNPTLNWTSNEVATFECKLKDGRVFPCGNGERGSWTGKNLEDGYQVLSVRGTDAVGNQGQFISRSWTVDESGPRLRFVGTYPPRARKLPRFRWTSNEYAFFECSLGGRAFRSCGKGLEGSWTKDEIPTGVQEFRVRGRDTKGNLGDIISLTIDIDTTGPIITLLKPLPTKTKQPTWTFVWTSNEIGNFTCAVDTFVNEVDCGFGLNGRFKTKPLADGRHSFYLLGEDALGNTARVVTHRWTVDKTKPEIEFLPNQPKISDADITLLWKTTSSKPAEFECALDNVRGMEPCGEGTTGSWTDANIPDGDHTLYVRAKDEFGDYGKIKTHSWRVDTKVPKVRLIGTPPKRSSYDSGSFYWTSDENANYECAIDLAESGSSCGSGVRASWISPSLDDKQHTFYLFATDDNGNQGKPTEYKWEIDTKPPIVTLDENTPRVSGHNLTLKWRTNEYAIFYCAVDFIFNDMPCGEGRKSELMLKDLENGAHTVWIKAVDELGNAAPPKEHTWTVDSKPPELDFTSHLPNKTNGSASFFWTSKDEVSQFKCGTDPNDLRDCGSGSTGNWKADNLSNGDHEFYVEATDEFGNTIRILHRWTVDNRPPVLSWRKRVPPVTGKLVTFKWKADEKAEFFCAHEKLEDMGKCGNFSLKGKWVEKDLPEGKHRFWVVGFDDVGNRGNMLHHEWVVDTKGPTVFFLPPVPKKSGRTVHFMWRSNERARFHCSIDNSANFSCGEGFESQLRSNNLRRNGLHELRVKGVDFYGNEGETAIVRWIVDLVAPVLIDVGPLPRLTNKNPIITWTVNEEAVFECALDDLDNYKWCGNGTTGEWRGKNLKTGDHRIVVRVKDPQGNSNPIIDHKFVVGIPDNRGREFILAFMQQYLQKSSGAISLFITSDNNTVANIYIPGVPGGFKEEVPLQADELVRVDLPKSARMSGTQREKKGVLVTAEHEMVVYGLNIMSHSTDAYLALPTDIQGTEYYAISYTVSQHSLIGIVGIYDNTVVYITLKMSKDVPLVYQGAVYRNGDTMILEIDRLFTFQLTHTEDLTGTRIASTKVVSVFSGNECANVPTEFGYCDHLVEMLTPTSTWGRRFVTAPLFSRKSGDFFRVVASQDNTIVIFHPNDQEMLQAGDFMERDVPSDQYKFITATKPCLLMQYSKGADTDNTNTDPFMLMIPPIEQYASHYILSTPDRPRQQYFQSYINVIVLSEHFRGVVVDGKPAHRTNSFKQIPGTPYSASAVKVTKGAHRVDHTSPIVTFGAFMYGYAWRDSYGYPGGLRLADITGECSGQIDTPADGMDNDCDRRIDEELKNGLDDDGDGRIDEDLATFPPTFEFDQPYYEYESCVFEVDALVPRPKAISSAECDYKGALKVTYRDSVAEDACTQLINRTWQASDGCGNVVYITQVIKIIRPRLVVRFPQHMPNGCVGSISLSVTGRPQIESPCKKERVRVAYMDNISKIDCQAKGLLLRRHFTVTEVCGREYRGLQRIYPGART